LEDSTNGGNPKGMVYDGKSYCKNKDDKWGVAILEETSICI
jgi:hypothetical protein